MDNRFRKAVRDYFKVAPEQFIEYALNPTKFLLTDPDDVEFEKILKHRLPKVYKWAKGEPLAHISTPAAFCQAVMFDSRTVTFAFDTDGVGILLLSTKSPEDFWKSFISIWAWSAILRPSIG
jgi:hypothetical protein